MPDKIDSAAPDFDAFGAEAAASNEETPRKAGPKRKPPEPDTPPRGSAPYSRHPTPVLNNSRLRLLLGPEPDGGVRTYRAEKMGEWPSDKTNREYFHRGLIRRLGELGGNLDAAKSIRRGLEDGQICAVVIDDKDGEACQIPPQRWLAAKTSAKMYWTGRAKEWMQSKARPIGTYIEGDIYLTAAPEPEPAPEPAEPELEAAMDSDAILAQYGYKTDLQWTGRAESGDVYMTAAPEPEPVPEPAKAKPADLRTRERTTVYKMLLAAVADCYGVEPGKRSDAAKQIAAKSEQFWPGIGVSERTVRDWLKNALDELGEPFRDET